MGRGVRAMDSGNLGRVFAPALMSWENDPSEDKDEDSTGFDLL